MEEIYVNESETLTLSTYVNGVLADPDGQSVNVEVKKGTTTVVSSTSATRSAVGKYTYSFPLSLTTSPAQYTVIWTYAVSSESVTHKDYVHVVVPYANVSEITTECPSLESKTLDEIKRMERRARHVINTYTGQSFDFEDDVTYTFTASGGNSLNVDRRVRRVEKVVDQHGFVLFERDVNGDITTEYVSFYEDTPFVLRKKYDWPYPEYEVKSDVSPYLQSKPLFKPGRVYRVTADWGWDSVPNEVNLATILLVETYFNPSSNYRRYGVWWADTEQFEMRFKEDLLGTTGNTEVDTLLMPYINSGIVMI